MRLALTVWIVGIAAAPIGAGQDVRIDRRGGDVGERLAARSDLFVADVGRATGADAADLETLEQALATEIDRTLTGFEETFGQTSMPVQMELIWRTATQRSEGWSKSLDEVLDDEERAAWETRCEERERRLFAARRDAATFALAAELRLREAQLDELRPRVAAWLRRRAGPPRSLHPGDVVAEMLDVRDIVDGLDPEQVERLRRMRSNERVAVPGRGEKGDDLVLGRGRYPEDDYVLDALALQQFHGWNRGEVDVLRRAAVMLGREARRGSTSDSWRRGRRTLIKPTVEPSEDPMWQAVVERVADEQGATAPVPPPACSGDGAGLLRARAELVLALLDERLYLDEERREALRPVVVEIARKAYRRGGLGFGEIDAGQVWRTLRLDERSVGRRDSATASPVAPLLEALAPSELAELGIEGGRR